MNERLVVIEHPYMRDAHLIAKVVGETKQMYNVTYWNNRRLEWKDETNRRAKTHVVSDLGEASEFDEKPLANWPLV